MKKYLVEVKLPAADLSYDMFIPDSMQIGTLTQLVASAFTKLSNGTYQASVQSILCRQETGKEYDPNLRVRDTEIRNGTKLFLF